MEQIAFKDPEKFLAGLRWVEENLPLHELPDKVRNLRTRSLRPILEMRQAALFSYEMSIAMGTKVVFALKEEADYDALCSFERQGERVFAPVQLKELVPERLNPESTLQRELDKLQKYSDSKELIVAYHLNRRFKFDVNKISPPQGVVAEIWIVAATTPDLNQWSLIGNILSDDCYTYKFEYPNAQNPNELV